MCGFSLRGLDDFCRVSYGEGRKGEVKEGFLRVWVEESFMEVCFVYFFWIFRWVGSCEFFVLFGNFEEKDFFFVICRVCLYGIFEFVFGDFWVFGFFIFRRFGIGFLFEVSRYKVKFIRCVLRLDWTVRWVVLGVVLVF